MPIDIWFRPTQGPAQQQRPWRSPIAVLVEPQPGEWC
jgi:hypothetical protein